MFVCLWPVVALSGIEVDMGVVMVEVQGREEALLQMLLEGGRVKACEYVRPWLILHVKLKCWVCQV
jgi:hypothetical protein